MAVVLAEGVAGVQDVSVASRAGVERSVVLAWEQRHNVVMPAALRSLYMATDGFKLTWNYSTAGTYILIFPFLNFITILPFHYVVTRQALLSLCHILFFLLFSKT